MIFSTCNIEWNTVLIIFHLEISICHGHLFLYMINSNNKVIYCVEKLTSAIASKFIIGIRSFVFARKTRGTVYKDHKNKQNPNNWRHPRFLKGKINCEVYNTIKVVFSRHRFINRLIFGKQTQTLETLACSFVINTSYFNI